MAVGNDNPTLKIVNCFNLGNVNGGDYGVGGLIGTSHCRKYKLYNCYNSGDITGTIFAGGLIGGEQWPETTYVYARNVYNAGKITGSKPGGIAGAGRAYSKESDDSIQNVYNVGEIISTSDINPSAIISDAYNVPDLMTAYYLDNCSIAVALWKYGWTYNSTGRGSSTKEYLRSQQFVNTLNEYVDTYNEARTEEDEILKKWVLKYGSYPIFE